MLQSLRAEMLQSLLDFLTGVVNINISVLEYIYPRLSLLNPGTQCEIGVGGFIGVIGCLLGLWVWTTGITVSLLGGFIGSGIYKGRDWNSEEQTRASEERMFAVLGGNGILRGRKQ